MAAWQGYAIELHFDPPLDAQIQTALDRLGRVTNRPESSTFKPRKTILTSPFLRNIPKLQQALGRFAAQHPPFPIYFNLIATGAATISTAPSNSVLQFHQQLYDALMQEGFTEFNWEAFTIYDSVAEGVLNMDRAFDELGGLNRVSGFGTEIFVVRYMPDGRRQFCFSCALGGDRSRL